MVYMTCAAPVLGGSGGQMSGDNVLAKWCSDVFVLAVNHPACEDRPPLKNVVGQKGGGKRVHNA